MQRRYRERIRWVPFVAITAGIFVAILDYGGYAALRATGRIQHSSLTEVIWHFFLAVIFVFVIFMLWPLRDDI
jgi:hypothetical protein